MNKGKINKLAVEDFKRDNSYAFGLLYENYFIYTKRFVLKNKGSIEDAEDLFQDAMLILYEKLSSDNFQTHTCITNYIMGITKNIWFKKLNNRNFFVEIPENYYHENLSEINLAIEKERDYLDKISDYLMVISTHCQNLILDIFYKNKNIEEIQAKYQYSSKHNAQNQKYKCIEQIKKAKEKDDLLRS